MTSSRPNGVPTVSCFVVGAAPGGAHPANAAPVSLWTPDRQDSEGDSPGMGVRSGEKGVAD